MRLSLIIPTLACAARLLGTRAWYAAGLLAMAPVACVQAQDSAAVSRTRLSLGFAVDTTAVPATWWGVDPALSARPAVVRLWRDYLLVRGDRARRTAFWSAADRAKAPDPDLVLGSDGYIVGANAVLVEALPLVAGDSTRWLLRTMYVGGGTAAHPGLLAMERMHVVREGGRWMLAHPSTVETAGWRRVRVGQLEYVVHPTLAFDSVRAAETAAWVDTTARRFGIADPAPITYYQLPNLEAATRVMGLDWALSGDRVGGRANPEARVVLAGDPRFGEAYRHEIAHVLLAPWLGEVTPFAGEGLAYWLGGARGRPFPGMMRDLAEFLTREPLLRLGTIMVGDQPAAASARFPAAAAVFELAHRRGGDAAVRRVVETTRRGMPTVAAVAAALGMTATDLEPAWRALVLSYSAFDSR